MIDEQFSVSRVAGSDVDEDEGDSDDDFAMRRDHAYALTATGGGGFDARVAGFGSGYDLATELGCEDLKNDLLSEVGEEEVDHFHIVGTTD